MTFRLFLLSSLFLALNTSWAQSQESYDDLVKIGDTLLLAGPSGNGYRYVDIPRKNFIIKRGGIADLSSLSGNKVLVTDIGSRKGITVITFTRANGKKFFRAYRLLTADLNNAIQHGEMAFPDPDVQELAK